MTGGQKTIYGVIYIAQACSITHVTNQECIQPLTGKKNVVQDRLTHVLHAAVHTRLCRLRSSRHVCCSGLLAVNITSQFSKIFSCKHNLSDFDSCISTHIYMAVRR